MQRADGGEADRAPRLEGREVQMEPSMRATLSTLSTGSIPFIILVLASIGVNPALIAIIFGVDRILDMCRTTPNVAGDITVANFVARSEGYRLLGEAGARR
jgi:Na+/H+-dicarboxylate symporter